jgi:hypothetical protein
MAVCGKALALFINKWLARSMALSSEVASRLQKERAGTFYLLSEVN